MFCFKVRSKILTLLNILLLNVTISLCIMTILYVSVEILMKRHSLEEPMHTATFFFPFFSLSSWETNLIQNLTHCRELFIVFIVYIFA